MNTIQIQLPERVKAVIDERIASGLFSTESDYVCKLIEDDQRQAYAGIESLLVSRVQGPQSVAMNAADWADMREEFRRRIENRGGDFTAPTSPPSSSPLSPRR